ncbi:DUF4148 domain-containing protein [Noviherbaspirillum aerium]|uniref:DUF4148 domain-containing protein n=1 Tax=Noviherbaspirillum aerium TaxID=2588497 RepID=UPI00124CFE43|nr:DUF4148 domain-containing protein [Noviherbaspirillum aerium]
MNVTKLIAAIATFVTAGSVFAQEYAQPDAGFVSTKSRAEVYSELAQARAGGTLRVAEHAYPIIAVELTKSRGDVAAELAQARHDGSLRQADHEYPVIQASGTPRTREEVRAELASAISSGAAYQPTNH